MDAPGAGLPLEGQALLARHALPEMLWPRGSDRVGLEALRDVYRGSLLWGAVGDALGRPNEGRSYAAIRERWGPDGTAAYHPWHGWTAGPRGTFTDDTQLTLAVAQSLIATEGHFDADDFIPRLIDWLPIGRGKGFATTRAINLLESGVPWWVAGPEVDSAGNGAAMRSAPVGLAWGLADDPVELLRQAALFALPTHAHPVGVAAAVGMAAATGLCIRIAAGKDSIDPKMFLDFVADSMATIETEPTPERRPPQRPVYLRDRVRSIEGMLGMKPEAAFWALWTGAFALESFPAALYCFLRAPDRPRDVLVTAANAGHDTDTIASMAGNLVGALIGADGLRVEEPEWWSELEARNDILGVADGLVDVARTVNERSPDGHSR